MTPREAWDAAIEAAAKAALRVLIPEDCSAAEAHGRMASSMAAAEAIRSLTPPDEVTAIATISDLERTAYTRGWVEREMALLEDEARILLPPDEADREAVARAIAEADAAAKGATASAHHRYLADAAIAALQSLGWGPGAKEMLEALRKAHIAIATWSPDPTEPLDEIEAAIAAAEHTP